MVCRAPMGKAKRAAKAVAPQAKKSVKKAAKKATKKATTKKATKTAKERKCSACTYLKEAHERWQLRSCHSGAGPRDRCRACAVKNRCRATCVECGDVNVSLDQVIFCSTKN